MVQRLIAVAGFATTLLGGSAHAVQTPSTVVVTAPQATAAAPAGVADDDRIICRSVRYTGSRFPERSCKTKKQMRLDQEAQREGADKFMDRNRRNTVNQKDGAYKTHSAPNGGRAG